MEKYYSMAPSDSLKVYTGTDDSIRALSFAYVHKEIHINKLKDKIKELESARDLPPQI